MCAEGGHKILVKICLKTVPGSHRGPYQFFFWGRGGGLLKLPSLAPLNDHTRSRLSRPFKGGGGKIMGFYVYFSFVFFFVYGNMINVQSKACCAVNECCIRQYEVPVWITLDMKKSILINNMVRSGMSITSMVDHCMETLQNQHYYVTYYY